MDDELERSRSLRSFSSFDMVLLELEDLLLDMSLGLELGDGG